MQAKRLLTCLVFTLLGFGVVGQPKSAIGFQLDVGDIVTVKQTVGDLFKIDPTTGDPTLISSGGFLRNPSHLLINRFGDIYTAERSGTSNGGPGIIRTDPLNGHQSYFAEGPLMPRPGSLDFDRLGNLFVGDIDTKGIVRVDRATGNQTLVGIADVDSLQDIAIAKDESIFALDFGSFNSADGQVIRVDPITGQSTTVSTGGFLFDPSDMLINRDGNLLVSNRISNFESQIVEIDVVTGAQDLLFTLPNSGFIALETPGTMVYADFSTRDILRVELATGNFSVLSPDVGNVHNLVGIAVYHTIPEPSSLYVVGLLFAGICWSRNRRRAKQSG